MSVKYDSTPETLNRYLSALSDDGVLDAAMIVQIALDRHTAMLRAHWPRQHRA